MNVQVGCYEIRPCRTGQFWEVFERNAVRSESGGVKVELTSLGIYPTTIGQALEYVYELYLKETPGSKDLKAAMATAKRLQGELMDIGMRTKEMMR